MPFSDPARRPPASPPPSWRGSKADDSLVTPHKPRPKGFSGSAGYAGSTGSAGDAAAPRDSRPERNSAAGGGGRSKPPRARRHRRRRWHVPVLSLLVLVLALFLALKPRDGATDAPVL